MPLSLAKLKHLLFAMSAGASVFLGTYLRADDCNQMLTPTGVVPSYSDTAATIQNLPINEQFDVLTQHNDIARTGAATHEDILTRSKVLGGQFGYLGSAPVEGKIYAQPLYIEKAAVECKTPTGIALRNANIIYVATLENLLYAIDVDTREVCWKTAKLGCGQPAGGLLGMDPKGEGGTRVGIVSTPVIDLPKSVLYMVTRNYGGSPAQTQFNVNTIDTRTGALVSRVAVSSDGANGCNGKDFKPEAHNNRPGLLLVGDKLFLGFGSTIGEDSTAPYHGFVLGFDVSDPAHPAPMPRVFCSTPTTLGGGIWMSGGGLASDGTSIYLTTGNGAYKVAGDIVDPEHQIPDKPRPGDYPDSFVKLRAADLTVQSSYTDIRTAGSFPGIPYVFDSSNPAANHTIFWARERSDADLGSGGLLLLGNRVIGGGKDGRIDVLDTNGLVPAQSFLAFFDADTDEGTDTSYAHSYNYGKQWFDGPNIHGGPVAWDVQARSTTPYIYVYAWSEKDSLKRFTFVPKTGLFLPQDARDASAANPTPSAHGSVMSAFKSMPGGMLSISANGASDGIVWAVVEEPYPNSRAWMGTNVDRCFGRKSCAGCFLSNGKFAEYCDATQGYVAGRLYAFAADDNGIGLLPLLWGDKRSAAPNNFIPRYSKFTPPTIAHGKVVVATANDEVRFYGLGVCPPSCVSPVRHADSIISAWNDGGGSTFAIFPSADSKFSPHELWKSKDGGWGDSIRWLSGDFDGDGYTDVAAIWNDNGSTTLTIRRSTTSTFMTPEHWMHGGPWDVSTQWLAGDFDGDGLTDIARIFNDNGRVSIDVYRSAGTYFEEPVRWATRDGGWGDSVKWVSGDFNGDGLSDIASIWNDGGTNTITVRKSTRSSFIPTHWIIHDGGWLDSTQWLAGDFDGDGLTDIAAVWDDGGRVTVAVYSSSGLQFAPHKAWATRDGGWGDSVKWVSGDFDGDGLSDIASIWNDGESNTITVRKSTSTSFTTSHWSLKDGAWLDSTKWLGGKFR